MGPSAKVSVIIPALDEARLLERQLRDIRREKPLEIIVIDGGSHDDSVAIAEKWSDRVDVVEGGLAAQLNRGARIAAGDVLFFPYADALLSEGWNRTISSLLEDPRVVGGAFRFGIDSDSRFSRWVALFSNLRSSIGLGPFGDQALFARRVVFEQIGGYREERLLEDLDLVSRLRRRGKFPIAEDKVVTSARRWQKDGALRTLARHSWVLALHLAGVRSDSSSGRAWRRSRSGGRSS